MSGYFLRFRTVLKAAMLMHSAVRLIINDTACMLFGDRAIITVTSPEGEGGYLPPRSFLANFHAINDVASAMIDVSRLAIFVISSITSCTSFLWLYYTIACKLCQAFLLIFSVFMKVFRTDTLVSLIACGEEHAFYVSPAWRARRKQVLALDRYECQRCKAQGRYARAVVVHHVRHLKDAPELALDIFLPDGTKRRQLISLCEKCHEAMHERGGICANSGAKKRFDNEERWD